MRQKPHPISNPSLQLPEIHVSPDHPVAKQLANLYREFVNLETDIRSALNDLTERGILQPIQIAEYIELYFRREELILTDATDIRKLFKALWPHYSYLDIEILEVIVENEKFQITKFQGNIHTYKQHLKEFKKSTTLNELKDAVEIALIPTPEPNETTCKVEIKLVDEWQKQKIEIFKLLIKYLFNHRMSHIHVKEGSLFVTLLVARSKLEYILKRANTMKEFALLVGIFELSINGKPILKEKEKTNFSFDQALDEASKISNVEAIKFLKSVKAEIVMISSAENEKVIQTGLESLSMDFDILMVPVRSGLERKLQNKEIVLVDLTKWIESRMNWVEKLTDVKDLNELFKKINLYFDFLDCGLIVDMSEEFLNDECYGKDKKSLVSELKEHTKKAENLRHSSTVKDLKDQLKTIYHPHHDKLSDMSQILISLHNPWNEASVDKLYLLIGHLLPDEFKQSIPKSIQIFTGSVIIKLFLIDLNVKRLISHLQDKLQFMHLNGIFSLTINDENVFKVDENMNFTFESSLLEAANVGHTEAVQFLLELGSDVDYVNNDGSTALMIATNSGHEQVVQLLLKEHANINLQGKDGETALMLASQNGYNQVVELLLKEHTNIDTQKEDGWTALMLASYNGHHLVVELLLKEHADINHQGKDGLTALMVASQNGHYQVVELLLKKNADVFIHNKEGCTALSLARDNGHVQVVELLLKEKEDIDIHQQKDRMIPIMIGSENRDSQATEPKDKEKSDVKTPAEDKNIAVMLDPEQRNTRQHLTRLISST